MGVPVKDVQTSVEQHCQKLILKRFDPKEADSIFHEQTEGQVDWLPELISHASWRSMIYQLSEQYPDCLMLNFAIKLISDAGYQQEIVSVKTASQQLDVFSGVLCTSVENVLNEGMNFQRAFDELSEICCQSEHTYVFSQSVLHKVANDSKSSSLKRIAQDLRQHAQDKLEYDVAPIQTALYNSMMEMESGVTASLHSMLEKRTLYAADINVLFNAYNANEPPPIELIRDQTLIALFIDAIFNPKTGGKLNPEHKSKYTYLLAYAASVQEVYKKGQRRMHNRDELKTTQQVNIIETLQRVFFSVLS